MTKTIKVKKVESGFVRSFLFSFLMIVRFFSSIFFIHRVRHVYFYLFGKQIISFFALYAILLGNEYSLR
jgi:hypothetical protein